MRNTNNYWTNVASNNFATSNSWKNNVVSGSAVVSQRQDKLPEDWYKDFKKELKKCGLKIKHSQNNWIGSADYVILDPKNEETVELAYESLAGSITIFGYEAFAKRLKDYLSTVEAVARRI